MLGLGFWEIALISIIVLIFVRPEELPRVMRYLGKFYGRITGNTEKFYQNFQYSAKPDYEKGLSQQTQVDENNIENKNSLT